MVAKTLQSSDELLLSWIKVYVLFCWIFSKTIHQAKSLGLWVVKSARLLWKNVFENPRNGVTKSKDGCFVTETTDRDGQQIVGII